MSDPSPSRLPTPYRDPAPLLAQHRQALAEALDWPAVQVMARPWLQALRAQGQPLWAVERLLQEFPINTPQGQALMRLAEGLLRVPDADTALTLIADQLAQATRGTTGDSLAQHLFGRSVALAQRLLARADMAPGWPRRWAGLALLAASRRALQQLGQQFVFAPDMAVALQAAQQARQHQPRLRYSYDMLGEGARTQDDALRYLARYEAALRALAARSTAPAACADNDGISIKLSALHPRFEDAQAQRVLAELLPRVWALCQQAASANIHLTIDAEEVERLELTLAVFEALVQRVAQHCPQWQGLGLAVQAYQTRSLDLVEHLIALARQHGVRLMCRLVKGAYWDTEIKRTQELGLPHYPVYTRKQETDLAYLACAQALLAASDAIYPQFASHNASSLAAVVQMARRAQAPYELQRLHGMGEGLYRQVLQDPQLRCRVYAPVGQQRDLLAYLVRRLLENGANASFVHQLADPRQTLAGLLASPLEAVAASASALPLPRQMFGPQRPNSLGLDLTVAQMRAPLQRAYAAITVPPVAPTPLQELAPAYQRSLAAYAPWRALSVARRVGVLQAAATALEQQQASFCALLVKEARKTWQDAVAEVREAVDLLRYYAVEAERLMQPLPLPQAYAGAGADGGLALGLTGERNTLRLQPRGVWVCISPWNFPLAIFIGQVAAALVTGNTVLAKPAAATPAVAQAAVRLLHQAGVPGPALQLLHGPGATLGQALVELPGIAGVVFTGSTVVAKQLQRALAAQEGPIVPLIAETGGINAMLVDSTALPEQVVDAVLQSAFRSAGQRCSALRLLCLHEAIFDTVMPMLQGAVAELALGDPADFATDVGPLIDSAAYAQVQRQVQALRGQARPWSPAPRPLPATAPGLAQLLPPQIWEVPSLQTVNQEIFGPVLQVLRWGAGALSDPLLLLAHINGLGYGLTLGLQTRIESRAHALAQAATVGNVYVNRSLIGAVVGLQPFGGQGLSGTGPKAGGPHYLPRFCTEQSVSINTAAAGGNIDLLAR